MSCISPATSFSLSELGGEGGCGGWGRGLGGDSGGRGEVDVSCSSVDTAWSIASFDEWDREVGVFFAGVLPGCEDYWDAEVLYCCLIVNESQVLFRN